MVDEGAAPTTVLVVGADSVARRTLTEFLTGNKIDVWEGDGVERGLAHVRRRPADVVLVCPDAASAGDARLVRDIRAFDDRTQVIAIVDSAERGRDALAAGAYDFFVEPVDLERLAVVLRHSCEAVAAREQSELLEQRCAGPACFRTLVTQDERLIAVLAAGRRLAPYDTPVLIVGPAGAGKESLARALHEDGRPGQPFVTAEGGALTPEALEQARAAASGGTLFIPALHALSPEVAAALVAVLDSNPGQVRVIGAAPTAARRSSQGTPREDLALRMAEAVLEMPPLAARPCDVVPIAHELLRRRAGAHEPPAITDAAADALRRYEWPGNVDELDAVLDAAFATAGGQAIEVHHLPAPLRVAAPGVTMFESRKLGEIEAAHLKQVLAETRGNKAGAARILGISRWALQRKLQKHGISIDELLS